MENTTFTVHWSSGDEANGSGLATLDVYVSDNGGDYTLWQSSTTLTRAAFTGLPGHTYRFYAQATDNVGHVQAASTAGDTVTQISTHIWHNVLDSLDVFGPAGPPDDKVVAADALAIINYINANGAGHIPPGAASGPPYLDTVDSAGTPIGDDFVVAGDALAVINFINDFGTGLPGPAGEGEDASLSPLSTEQSHRSAQPSFFRRLGCLVSGFIWQRGWINVPVGECGIGADMEEADRGTTS